MVYAATIGGAPFAMTGHPVGNSPDAVSAHIPSRSIVPGRRLRIGVLHNPLSGRNHADSRDISRILAQYPPVLVREVRNPSDILSALETFAQKEIELILVNGGDGTIQATLTALFHHMPFEVFPFLAVLPSGTTNMIAGDVGLRGNRKKTLERICRWIPGADSNPPLVTRHVLRVESDFHPTPLWGMFFGTGGILQGIDYCRRSVESKGLRGEIGPALALGRFLLALLRGRRDVLNPVPLWVSVDGRPLEHSECLALLISTLDHLFLGMRPYWGCEPAPLFYTHIRAHPTHLWRVLGSVLRGRSHPLATKEHGYESANVQSVELRVPGGFTLDGELFTHGNGVGTILVHHAGQVSFVQW